MTNCHNSLCAVGGTINEDDHIFGLSAAKKYGGIYVPANQAVIHQYAREMMTGCGRMILGSDSHTRYGALGTMGVGEGGPEIVKQLLSNTYDVAMPDVVLVYLTGKPARGVGPQDVAIALCGAVYDCGFVKNKVLEFAGPGVASLPMDYRIGIDVMTTETACLSSIWQTDEKVEEYLAVHGRPETYQKLEPEEGALYDSVIEIDLSKIEPMVAMPFHPSRAFTVRDVQANGADILRQTELLAHEQFGGKVELHLTDKLKNGKLLVDQGIIAGCSGGMYDNIAEAAAILDGQSIGDGYFSLSIYPPSIPINLELMKNGIQQTLLEAGALFKPCFCGPCFGAGDVPGNDALSIRHTTRNFPNREGSKPASGQLSGVMLMDARSIAATARNARRPHRRDGDRLHHARAAHTRHLTAASIRSAAISASARPTRTRSFASGPEHHRVAEDPGPAGKPAHGAGLRHPRSRDHYGRADPLRRDLRPTAPTRCGWPSFALSRRDPQYVGRAKAMPALESARTDGTLDVRDCRAARELRRQHWRTPASALSSLPTSPATALPANRPPAARECSAAAPISAMNTRRSATAPTASTGACSPSTSTRM